MGSTGLQVEFSSGDLAEAKVEVVGALVSEGDFGKQRAFADLDDALGGALAAQVAKVQFRGKADEVLEVFDDVPSTELTLADIGEAGIGVVDLVARVRLAPSKSEARRLVQSGGVYINNRRATDPQARLTREQAIGGELFLVRKGQKQNHLVRITR